MKASVSIEWINKARALEYLAKPISIQRPQRQSYIKRLASEMGAKKWRLSSDAIVVVKGMLANGQHRLMAVVLSDCECQFLVLTTDDEKLYEILDCGINRSVPDVLGAPYSRTTVAAARLVLGYQRGLLSTRGHCSVNKNRTLSTRSQLIEFCRSNNASFLEHIEFIWPLYVKHRVLSAAQGLAVAFIGSQVDKEKTREFVGYLYSGEAIGNAAIDLRERLNKASRSAAKLPPSYIFGISIKAMRAFFAGQRAEKLSLKDGEAFPSLT